MLFRSKKRRDAPYFVQMRVGSDSSFFVAPTERETEEFSEKLAQALAEAQGIVPTTEEPADASASAPGANGVFVVIPFVDEDDPSNLSGARDDAKQLIEYLAHESSLELTAHVLDDRDVVTEIAQRLKLRPAMAANGIFVAVPFSDPSNPGNPLVLQAANDLVESFAGQDIPAGLVDNPQLVERVADSLVSKLQ